MGPSRPEATSLQGPGSPEAREIGTAEPSNLARARPYGLHKRYLESWLNQGAESHMRVSDLWVRWGPRNLPS